MFRGYVFHGTRQNKSTHQDCHSETLVYSQWPDSQVGSQQSRNQSPQHPRFSCLNRGQIQGSVSLNSCAISCPHVSPSQGLRAGLSSVSSPKQCGVLGVPLCLWLCFWLLRIKARLLTWNIPVFLVEAAALGVTGWRWPFSFSSKPHSPWAAPSSIKRR